jgi:hypothetical protein
LQPGGAGDGGEAVSEEIGDGAPLGLIIFRQAYNARADAVFDG